MVEISVMIYLLFLMFWETANERSPHSHGVEAGGMGK